jgi:hypothetical protein
VTAAAVVEVERGIEKSLARCRVLLETATETLQETMHRGPWRSRTGHGDGEPQRPAAAAPAWSQRLTPAIRAPGWTSSAHAGKPLLQRVNAAAWAPPSRSGLGLATWGGAPDLGEQELAKSNGLSAHLFRAVLLPRSSRRPSQQRVPQPPHCAPDRALPSAGLWAPPPCLASLATVKRPFDRTRRLSAAPRLRVPLMACSVVDRRRAGRGCRRDSGSAGRRLASSLAYLERPDSGRRSMLRETLKPESWAAHWYKRFIVNKSHQPMPLQR